VKRNDPPFVSVRHYSGESWEEFRGTVCRGAKELDVCGHRHRSEAAARRCAKRMLRKIAKEVS
jgi:hypothetical protein